MTTQDFKDLEFVNRKIESLRTRIAALEKAGDYVTAERLEDTLHDYRDWQKDLKAQLEMK